MLGHDSLALIGRREQVRPLHNNSEHKALRFLARDHRAMRPVDVSNQQPRLRAQSTQFC